MDVENEPNRFHWKRQIFESAGEDGQICCSRSAFWWRGSTESERIAESEEQTLSIPITPGEKALARRCMLSRCSHACQQCSINLFSVIPRLHVASCTVVCSA